MNKVFDNHYFIKYEKRGERKEMKLSFADDTINSWYTIVIRLQEQVDILPQEIISIERLNE